MSGKLYIAFAWVILLLLPQNSNAQADTAGVITNGVTCNSGHNGSIFYNVTGGPGPVKYSWSNGSAGYATGNCTYLVSLNNPDSALSQFQVQVNVNLAPGMDSSFSNIVFLDSAGNKYPFWLTDFPTDSSATFWVRVPSIPSGISTFYLSFCGNDTVSQGNPYATFEFFDNFDSLGITPYTSACINVDQNGESCGSTASNSVSFSAPNSLYLSGAASCFGPNYDGAGASVTRNVPLVNDSLVVDYEDMASVELYGYCQGGTGTTNTVFADNVNLGNGQSVGQGGSCAVNTTTWRSETSLPFNVTTGTAAIKLQTVGGDCDNSQGWFDDVRVRKYRATPPVVTLSITPQLSLDSLAAGTYTLTMISINGDTTKRSITITQPAPINVITDSSGNPCIGTGNAQAWTHVSGGTTPYTFLWSNSQTSDSISNLANGSYQVTVTDQHLCSAVAGVAINVTPKLSFTTALDSASCNLPNGYAHITVAGGLTPYTYHWLPDVSDSAGAIGLSTIQYQVTIIDSNGCAVSDTFTIGGKNTVVTRPYLGKDTTICPGTDKLVLNAGSFLNYFWQDSSTQQHFMVVDTGKFWVIVTDSNGCQASDSILIGDYCSTKFVVPSAFTPNGDGKNDFFIPLYIDPPASFTMHIYDRWGDLVFQTNNVTVGWDGKFKGKEQPVGTYIYYIQYTFQGQKEQGLHGALELLR